eukprot:scaffold11439_cov122-Isochrysis_galbana.AAC.3
MTRRSPSRASERENGGASRDLARWSLWGGRGSKRPAPPAWPASTLLALAALSGPCGGKLRRFATSPGHRLRRSAALVSEAAAMATSNVS